MDQSSWIAGYIILAFFIFITMRGELPKYMGFLLSTPEGGGTGVAGLGSGNADIGKASAAISQANFNKGQQSAQVLLEAAKLAFV